MNRIFYLLLSIIMAANVNVARAWEYPTSDPGELPGSGTKEDPYRISTAQELANFAYRVNNGNTYYQKYVVLNADITLNEKLLNEDGNPLITAKQWTHIGFESRNKSFKGIFDGQNHTVCGVYTDDDTQTGYVGFFGFVYQATVKNLIVSDSYLSGNNYDLAGVIAHATSSEITNCSFHGTIVQGLVKTAGGIVGYSSSCTIDNCHFSGAIRCKSGSDGADYIGGILGNGGDLTLDNTDIKNCTVDADIKDADTSTSTCDFIGGIAGYCYNVSNCVVKNSSGNDRVSSLSAKYVGGIVGYAKNAVTNCNNSSEVYLYSKSSTAGYVGGIAGYAYDVSTCCNYAPVTAWNATSYYLGGVVGCANNKVTDSRNYKQVRCNGAPYCYVGGVAGYGYALSVCANFGDVDLSACSTSESYSDFCCGGVIGWNGGGDLENCFNYGKLYTGIGGMNYVYLAGVAAYAKGVMKYCVNMGTVTTNTPYSTYALAQYSNYGLGNNNFFIDTTAKSASASEASTGKQPLSFFQSDEEESLISKMEASSNWSVASWGLDPATKLPIPVAWGGVDVSFVMNDKGAGTLSDPYLITNYDELTMLNRNVAKGHDYKGIYFQQTCDFDFSKNEFTPLGTASDGNWKAFLGHYDGDDHTVKNISYTSNTWFPTGFFAELGEGAEVKNLKFTDNSLTVSAAGKVGMVAGKATKASLSGIYVRDCKINQTLGSVIDIIGSQIGYNYGAGGLVGIFTGNISRCSVYYTDITGNQIGGLAGLMLEQTTVEDAVVQASLHASTYNVGEKSNYPQCAGGITSRASDVKVARCVVLPTVDYATYDSWGYIGGLFGVSYSGNSAEYTMCNMNEPENTASRWGHLMGINEGATSLTATNVQIYDKNKYKSSYGEELSNTEGIKDFVNDLHGWSPIYLNSGASNLGNMHFSYYHALPQQGIGSYAVTSANGECSAYTDMSDYGEDFWTRPDNLYIDLSYPEVSSDNNVLTAVGDIDPLIVERKSNVVNSEGQASKIYLYDGKPVAYHSAITAKTLSYSRNFTNTSWQPLYVPFAMTYDQWTSAELEVATLNGMNIDQDENGKLLMQLSISKVTEGRIEANTPCLIRSNEVGEKKMELTDVTMAVTNMSSHVFGNDNITVTINPTYFELDSFNGYEDESTNDYIMKDGKFGRAAVNAILKPQRWYFTLSKDNAEASDLTCFIPFEFNGEGGGGGFGGSATKIEDIQVVTAPTSTDRLYDLQGRRLTTAPQKGVYIMNNKKVVK
ncbi:MAG: GLUG motif-containing protein [Prevotella sp.]